MTTLRLLPSIDRLRQRAGIRVLELDYGTKATLAALRTVVENLRHQIDGSDPPEINDREHAAVTIERLTASELVAELRFSLTSVINATGVIVHTNLGRAPLAATAAKRVAELVAGYTNLEYDLAAGRRGARHLHAKRLLNRITGAPAAVVVNNNAAALLLILSALAHGREVIVSRGELVEIGGGFRIPDIMRQAGVELREVGTTNKTRVTDFAAAISDRTALILSVHPSNFRIEGFTERPEREELVALGQRFNLPVVEDLGSGNLLAGHIAAELDEPTVAASISAGVAVCCFSGDKLLGGPQAGIIVGKPDQLRRITSHPLMRALRVDKMTYAALEATLLEYAVGRAHRTVPVVRMLLMTVDQIEVRANALAAGLTGHNYFDVDVVAGVSTVGGGGAPGSALPTRLTRLKPRHVSASALETKLRTLQPPIVSRIEHERVLLDLRTVMPEQDKELLAALAGLS